MSRGGRKNTNFSESQSLSTTNVCALLLKMLHESAGTNGELSSAGLFHFVMVPFRMVLGQGRSASVT